MGHLIFLFSTQRNQNSLRDSLKRDVGRKEEGKRMLGRERVMTEGGREGRKEKGRGGERRGGNEEGVGLRMSLLRRYCMIGLRLFLCLREIGY